MSVLRPLARHHPAERPTVCVCGAADAGGARADVRTLCEGGWLSDAVVSFFFEHLRHEELAALSRRVLLVPPDMTMLLCCLPPTQARAALGDLDAASRDLVRRWTPHPGVRAPTAPTAAPLSMPSDKA